MLKERPLLGFAICVVLALACGEDKLVRPDLTFEDPEAFVIDGTVRFLHIENGCWVIQTRDGTRYEPFGLPEELKADGIRVRAAVKLREEFFSICQVGTTVEIVEIQRYRIG